MVKKIKFNILVDGISISDFDQLQDNFSPDLLNYIENQKLSKWFGVRDMDDKAQQVAEIDSNASSMEQMKALCRVLELEGDEDVITYLLEEQDVRNKEQSEKLSNIVYAENPDSDHEQGDLEDVSSKPKGEDWSGRDFNGRDFTGADLRGYNLSGTDFTNANLTDTDLSGCDLSKAIFTGAKLIDTNFSYSNLREALLTEIRGFWDGRLNTDILNDVSTKSDAANSKRKSPNFTHATLDKAVLSGCFANADFSHVHAHEVNASGYARRGSAKQTYFTGANMLDADFSFSTFGHGTIIYETQVRNGNFLGVKFECSLENGKSWLGFKG